MITVKLTIPGQLGSPDLSQYTGNDKNVVSGCHFVINDPSLAQADAWIVIDGLDQPEICRVPANRISFLTAEVMLPLDYYISRIAEGFLSQFSEIHSCFIAKHPHVHRSLPFQPWMINANHGSFFRRHERDLPWLQRLESLPKTHEISVFCSNVASTPAHRVRLEFVEALKQALGDRLHWFGNGINPVSDKWEGLAKYKYHIVLENQRSDDVITEKIIDSFLSLGFPLYWGAPNASKYFPPHSFREIEITNLKGSIGTVLSTLAEDPYLARLVQINRAKDYVLQEYNCFERMARIAKAAVLNHPSESLLYIESVRLLPMSHFMPPAEATQPTVSEARQSLPWRVMRRLYRSARGIMR